PYLLALALAVNAGSVATVTGNPQNVLVAVAADISYGRFLAHLAPVALLSLVVVFAVVLSLHGRELTSAGAAMARVAGAGSWATSLAAPSAPGAAGTQPTTGPAEDPLPTVR